MAGEVRTSDEIYCGHDREADGVRCEIGRDEMKSAIKLTPTVAGRDFAL